jgi:hypothetical protein
MSAITFESVLTQAERLSPPQRAELISVLARGLAQSAATPPAPLSSEERRARVEAFQGKYRGSLSSVDEFLAAKREEVELEEARYLARHPEEAPQ